MEIQVKITKILDAQRFVSRKDGSEIVKNTFIGETQGQYPKTIAFTVMGKDKFDPMGIVVGGTYNVSFDVESREWQGKWFTEASAWKSVRMDGAQGQQQANTSQAQAPTQATQQANANTNNGGSEAKSDDLPF